MPTSSKVKETTIVSIQEDKKAKEETKASKKK